MGRPRFKAGTPTTVPWSGLQGEIGHEYDAYGNHRITYNGKVGNWVDFASIAVMVINKRTFRAYSDHFPDMNEIEEVLAVHPRKFWEALKFEPTAT